MQQFLTLLQQVKLNLDAEAIADALWLACQLDPDEVTEPSEPAYPVVVDQRDGDHQSPPPLPRSDPPDRPAQLSASPPPQPRAQPSTANGLPFQTPAAPALRNSLELGRSLRPLMRKVSSRTEQSLDEEATAIRIAESAGQRQWVPVFQPAPERWLDLALVVEETRSTVIWQELIAEFQILLERQGAFRNIRTWSLRSDTTGTISLFPRFSKLSEPQRPRSPKELLNPTGRQLILLVSDCVSPTWRQGKLHSLLRQWSSISPTTIVQLLPERLWARSALGLGLPARLSAFLPGVPNSQLEVTDLPVWETVDLSTALTLPIVTLEPESLGQWAQVVGGMGNAQTTGIVFDLAFVVAQSQTSTLADRMQRTPEELVQRFRATASPLARRLAGLMSVVQVSLPIVHLIQEAVLPTSRQVHVAEVFMSGLLEPQTTQTSSEQVRYEFVSGVRELLRASVPKTEALMVLDKISQYIAERAGLSIKSFAALLVMNAEQGTVIEQEVQRFAEISADVLRGLGGEYAALVEQLETPGSSSPSKITNKKLSPHEFLKQSFDEIRERIAYDFVMMRHEFKLDPDVGEEYLEEESPEDVDQILLVDEAITVNILSSFERRLDVEEPYTFFELPVQIHFSVEIRHFNLEGLSPDDTKIPTFSRVISNQVTRAVAKVNLFFPENGSENCSAEPMIDSLQLAVHQPIFVTYAEANALREDTLSASVPPSLMLFEFDVATIAFESLPNPFQMPEIELEPFEFEFASIELQPFGEQRELSTLSTRAIFARLDEAVFAQTEQHLSHVQLSVLEGTWDGESYMRMADKLGYDVGHIKNVGAELWSQLSEVCQQKVTKQNVQTVVIEWLARAEEPNLIVHRQRQQGWQFLEDLGATALRLVSIQGGSFLMGSPEDELGRSFSEGPQHTVTVRSFLMGKYPVTQAQWRAVADLPQVNRELNPESSRFKGKNRPVENVSWYEAVEFCDRLSQYTGKEYRLPTEAEWEYACRAGTTTPFHFGETITTDLANYRGTDNNKEYGWLGSYGQGPKGVYREETTEVGSFLANAFGLYDMHGNVWEWCLDHWHSNYEGSPIDGSAWLTENENNPRLLRGGSWVSGPRYCRSAYRDDGEVPGNRDFLIGFRVVCSASWTL